MARRFIREDGSYAKYDEPYVAQNDVLSRADVELVRCFEARTGKVVEDRILARRTEIDSVLERIPAKSTLFDDIDTRLWEALEQLLSVMISIKGVDISVATKVLHKKRSALIPILDSVVRDYLLTVDGISKTKTRGKFAVALMRSYKRDLDANADVLRQLRADLNGLGYYLTECRILDMFVWAYSGIYTPPFENKRLRRSSVGLVKRAIA
ncbi:MAG TPA: DUF6308 family protein [Pyrinomonadaceae bacterium]|nr:DUF6308 family protein [Pyrinomonadaceae bacterium]